MSPRYAIYIVPSIAEPIGAFGASAIGYDSTSGRDVPFPAVMPFTRPDWPLLTEDARRYGFHATLKAPFALKPETGERDLLEAASAFAGRRLPFAVPLAIARLGAFVALVPAAPSGEIDALAADCVRDFEPFRAPLAEADRLRRLAAGLSARQVRHLDAWGYPYVLADFRFHMTLTGPLPEPLRDPIRAALARAYAGVEPELRVRAVCLCRQDDRAGRFRVLARLPFGAPSPLQP